LGHQPLQQRHQQLVLAGEVVEEAALADLRLLGDRLHAQVADAAGADEPLGGVEDPIAGAGVDARRHEAHYTDRSVGVQVEQSTKRGNGRRGGSGLERGAVSAPASASASTSAPVEAQTSLRRVILASSLGTVFEWYDFYLYDTLAVFFGELFFPKGNERAALLASLATFGAGFGVRPLGALVFGRIGDLVGRKYTFLVTIVTMGLSTALIGFLPTY